ncbi:hypothetical protein FHT00_002656 [Sphingomonas insulae]|uniref:DUF4173 domain-containing protein n=1 Tax=Sphingomonas insulae TaxID=424800 RepID=A0ABN1HZW2_9SPHN|nr:DUF4173 domain-containing protein [Sphingomonas insulae]NIJ30685.1 hypothetical protein [Sphingomonas insulae]
MTTTTTTTAKTPGRRTRPGTLAMKIAAMTPVVVMAEWIFAEDSEIGGVIGLLAIVWVAMLSIGRPIVLRSRSSRIALIAAAGYAVVLADDPNALALLLGWIAISMAALLPRRRFDHALRWVPRLGLHALVALGLPWRDLAWSAAARRRSRRGGLRAAAAMLVVPVLGGAVFLTLFANANPLIAGVFERIAWPDLGDIVWRIAVAAVMATAVWATLRPRLSVRTGDTLDLPARVAQFDPGSASLVLSLATFNVIFTGQNVLDILFLWSGAPLPGGVTMADYAHRGAYALIVTALLAAVFVLVTLRPGSSGTASPAVRRLVTLWIMQNLLLVASSALRLVDYIQAYAMTAWRLAALAWMALVATGLALILWRLLRGRSAAWLINANALAAALVLSAASAVDLKAMAAAWNADVAITQGRAGPPLDLCYLATIGPSGLTALARLERHARNATLRDRLAYLRWEAQVQTKARQGGWRSWTGRNARRLAAVEAMMGPRRPLLRAAPNGRECGWIYPVEPALLTKAAQR